jgi:hypothetical protein
MTRNALTQIVSAGMFLTLVLAGFTPAGAQSFAGVLTQHNDVARTGQNLSETILNTTNVTSTTFGKVFSYSVDGQIYAQPLYVPNVSIGGNTYNVIYVETQNDSLYAFDADGLQATPLWQVSFISPSEGITAVPCEVNGVAIISCAAYPIWGITATPVIDPTTNTMYLVTRTADNGTYLQTLHAIDITSGAEKFGGPVNISGSVPGTGSGSQKGIVTFDPLRDIQRVGLLEVNGVIYIAWAGSAHGWIMAYNATTLEQTAIFNTSPNSSMSGIWQTGNGLAADSSGNIYVATGNGTFDASTGGSDYGDSLLQLNSSLGVLNYFTPDDQACRAKNDLDLGSGGPLILPTQPGSVPNELIIAGKGGKPCDTDPVASRVYLLNQADLGGYNATQDNDVEEIIGSTIGYYSSFAYWQGASATNVYGAGQNGSNGKEGDNLKMYTVTNGLLSTTPTAQSTNTFPVGATPSISANSTSDGIVWAIDRPESLGSQPGTGAAVLYAYDATNVATMLYNSAEALSQKVARDRGGCGNKFAVPTVANGRVYVGTQNELDVFGLLGTGSAPGVYLADPCYTFATSAIGTTVSEAIKMTNSGTAALTISSIAVTGNNAADFNQTNTCPASLAAGKACVITVSFDASVLGPEWANVMITNNAVGSPHNIYVIGVGEAAAKAVATAAK